MRGIAFVSIVLFGCTTGAGPAELDNDLPARLDCTSAGTYSDMGNVTWRGSIDPAAGTVDLVRGPLHPEVAIDFEGEQPEIHETGAVTWDRGAGVLAFDSEALPFTFERSPDVRGFLVEGTLDVGADEPAQVWCWNPEIAPGFAYDDRDGVCRDADGVEGTEPRPIGLVRETGDAQCADLRGVALDEEEYMEETFDGFDWRGADLTGASLHFASITEAALQGAKLAGLDYGYATITGDIDEHTTIPETGCEAGEASLSCFN